jgi:exopolysaccharide biosynthesis protein
MKSILFLLFSLTTVVGYGQHGNFLDQHISNASDSIGFIQIKTDSIFESKQVISLIILPKINSERFSIDFSYSQPDLRTTSSMAKSKNALAAINGGFFNMDSGGGVTYFEIVDSVINKTRKAELKWGIADSIINGAIVVTNELKMLMEPARSEQYYESSKQESVVMVTGPLLLLNGEAMELPNMKFSNNRHPRTCLCLNQQSIIFVTIDGRSKQAEGMNLIEVQKFLSDVGCTDAINLDGGGSTTMWIRDKGIVNFPSDKSGERPVANALLILKKSNR